MSRLQILGRDALAVRPLQTGTRALDSCLLPAPRAGEVCSLPEGHPGDHEVQILALVTIDRFTSDLENPVQQPDRNPEDAATQRAQHTDKNDRPRSPRSRPTPRDVRGPQKPDQR